MKKVVQVGSLLVVVALLMLLVIGSAGATPPPGYGSGEHWTKPEGIDLRGEGATLREDAPKSPSGTALRINFEVSGQKAQRGLYLVEDSDGNRVASWWANGGEVDSGWFENLAIARETVLVRVLYYPGPNAKPTVMTILNHAPGSTYGWVSRGIGHAIEVAWPGQPPMHGGFH